MIRLRYISLGAGVQSSTLYALAARGEIGPMPDVAIFADTQAEPKWVYEQLDYLEAKHGDVIPIVRVTDGSLTDALKRALPTENRVARYASIPFWTVGDDGRRAPGRRQCTREHKIDPIKREARRMLGVEKGRRVPKNVQAEEWVGISMDEIHRAKPSRYPWIVTRWPLLFDRPMRRAQCIQWMETNGYKIPKRSACFFCPYHGNDEWKQIRDEAPELWKQAIELDDSMRAAGPMRGMRRLQYMHRSLVPLREAVLDEDTDDSQLDLFQNECEGMCGV